MLDVCEAYRRELVDRVVLKTLQLADKMLDKGSVTKAVKTKDGVEYTQEELSTKDLKDIIDMSDRASLTLGVHTRESKATKDSLEVLAPFRESSRSSGDADA